MDILEFLDSRFLLAIIIKITLLVGFSFSIWIILLINRNYWVKTEHYFITFLLLPVVAFVITKVISGNLALSLGMIGALSIIRFRNPVKSPLELVVYFLLMTLGISCAVSTRWFLILFFVSLVLFTFIYILKKISIFNLLFKDSDTFSSFENSNQLEILSEIDIGEYLPRNNISAYSFDNNKYSYLLISSEINDLQIILDNKIIKKNITSFKLNKI